MHVLAELDGVATPHQIASQIVSDSSTLARTERHLINAGCISVTSDGSVQFAGVITSEDMSLISQRETRYARMSEGLDVPGYGSVVRKPRCNAVMPRARARCVLPHGHAGRHRSR